MSDTILIAVFTDFSIQLFPLLNTQNTTADQTSNIREYSSKEELIMVFGEYLKKNSAGNFKQLALILPHTWIDTDGKITSSQNSLISQICQTYSLVPVGFMASDDALLDYYCQIQGVPSSPVLINIGPQNISVSISDMGNIKKRIQEPIEDPQNLISQAHTLISSLAKDTIVSPKILVWGDFDSQSVIDFTNFSWIDKDNQNVFLHFPDIEFFDLQKIETVYQQSINSQLGQVTIGSSSKNLSQPDTDFETSIDSKLDPDDTQNEIEKPQDEQGITDHLDSTVTKVDQDLFGFSKTTPISIDSTPPANNPEPSMPMPQLEQPVKPAKKLHLKFPKLNKLYLITIPVLFLFVPIIFYFFFYKVQVDVFINPVDVGIEKSVTIDNQIDRSDLDKNLVAVKKNQSSLTVQSDIKTTGTITIGDKAQGKIAIFNKTDNPITLNKGQIFSTDNDLNFVLLNDTQIEASSLNLEEGLISMGKTIAVASASNIGTEGNIPQSTNLSIDGFSADQLIARVEESFSGGTSQTVASVAEKDKQNLKEQLTEKLTDSIKDNNQTNLVDPTILKSTIVTNQPNIEYNREVGEASDSLSATMESVVSYYSIYPDDISNLISYLSKDNLNWQIDTNNSQITFDFVEEKSMKGNLSLSGRAVPVLSLDTLSNQMKFKNTSQIFNNLQNVFNRIYDYNIRSNCPLKNFPLMPPRSSNIQFLVKIET